MFLGFCFFVFLNQDTSKVQILRVFKISTFWVLIFGIIFALKLLVYGY